jgi:hypothetical protein
LRRTCWAFLVLYAHVVIRFRDLVHMPMYKDVLEGVYPKMWHRAARRWLLVTSGVRHVDLAPGRELLTTVIEMHHLVSRDACWICDKFIIWINPNK